MNDRTPRQTLLVVDDDGVNLAVLGTLLAPYYEVLAAPSGARALRLAAGTPVPDLILLDVVMPEMDGYEVLARLRSNPVTRDIPVIFVTGMDSVADEERGFELGAVDYVAKPYRPPIILARVHTHLELKRARDRLANQNAWLEAEVARRTAENRLILESAAEGIFGADADGVINFINPAALAMLGYRGSELIGRPAHAVLEQACSSTGDASPEECPVHIACRSGVATRGKEQIVRRKDGERLPVELSAIPLRRDGKLLGAVASFTDISERKRYLAQLERRSNYDDLSGLPNRNLLADRLAQAIGHCRVDGGALAVLLCKLDRFDEIVDSLGHDAGDRVLCSVAAGLAAQVPPGATLARVASDEFVVLAACGEAAAGTLAKTLLAVLAAPVQEGGRELFLSASIGIAMFPKDGEEGDTLLKNAGAAMARGRSAGGGIFRFYAVEMNQRSLERLDLESDLRRALERGEFLLHYQPQLSLRSGALVGCEALLRWQHPQRGLLLPGAFIRLAEEVGLIAAIGEWVVHTACRQSKAWLDAGLPRVTMAVNLSAQQFVAQDVVALAESALRDTGLDPGALELELTESAVMADAEAFIIATRNFKKLGINVSIDDFGTGFSSLSYLRRFSFDRLKIDMSFVRDITHDPNSAAIVQAIISLGHTLKFTVIAEGVETDAQLRFLRRHGCDEMQGFYFSPAVPPADFERMLDLRRRLELPPLDGEPEPAVLLVDDEPGVLSALRRLLRREGYRILTADSGREGLDLMAGNTVAVVISDARMPQMSGPEFLDRVRRLYPDSVRIILSGHTDLAAVTEAVNKSELFKFLTKPWDDEDLRRTLREAMQLYRTRRRPESDAAPAGDPRAG